MPDIETQETRQEPLPSYRASSYNFIYEIEPVSVLYNTFTGAMAILSGEEKNATLELLRNPDDGVLCKKYPRVWQNLLKYAFVVGREVNEMDFVKIRLLKSRFSARSLNLVLLPTRRCNFRCVYCFEDPLNTTMNREDCIEVTRFAEEQVKEIEPPRMTVNWYGGEPLLVPDVMGCLSAQLKEICAKVNIPYRAALITNGYLLTHHLASRLRDMGVGSIQITLDGPARIHNERRISKDAQPTFDRIKEAILIANEVFDSVDIRVHVDKDNINVVCELLEEDWLYGRNMTLHAAYLKDYSGSCIDWASANRAVDGAEVMRFETKFESTVAKKKGIAAESNWKALIDLIPVKGRYCGIDYMGCWVLGPKRLVYRCATALNVNDECGHIENGKFHPNSRFAALFLSSPADEQKCGQCILLPLCMGGCAIIRKRYADVGESGICDYWRAYLELMIKDIIAAKRRSE